MNHWWIPVIAFTLVPIAILVLAILAQLLSALVEMCEDDE